MTSPAGPPQKKQRSRACLWGCAGALAAVIVIVVIALVVTLGTDDDGTTPAPTETATSTETTPQEPRGERADLISFNRTVAY